MSDYYVTVTCTNEDCGTEVELPVGVSGRYLPQTYTDPAEYPTPELEGEAPDVCPDCGHVYDGYEQTVRANEVEKGLKEIGYRIAGRSESDYWRRVSRRVGSGRSIPLRLRSVSW